MKLYKRTKDYRAPPELTKVHPLGKSPVIEIIRPGAKPLVVAETGHIIDYLVKNYDTEKKLLPASAEERELVDYYLSFTEGSFQSYLVALLINDMATKIAPFGTRFLVTKVVAGINAAYYGPETKKALDFLEANLKANPGKYFVGDKLTGADIILSFPVYENIFKNPENSRILAGISGDFVSKYPNLKAWSDMISKEPNLIKADEIIDQKMGSAKL